MSGVGGMLWSALETDAPEWTHLLQVNYDRNTYSNV